MYLTEAIDTKKPPTARPKLNNGATLLLQACPRSLNALSQKLNHGDKYIEMNINSNGIETLKILNVNGVKR